jgi:hypothetical protein
VQVNSLPFRLLRVLLGLWTSRQPSGLMFHSQFPSLALFLESKARDIFNNANTSATNTKLLQGLVVL